MRHEFVLLIYPSGDLTCSLLAHCIDFGHDLDLGLDIKHLLGAAVVGEVPVLRFHKLLFQLSATRSVGTSMQ